MFFPPIPYFLGDNDSDDDDDDNDDSNDDAVELWTPISEGVKLKYM